MTKIIGFKNRLASLGNGIIATVGTILYIISIILEVIAKVMFYVISFLYIILIALIGVALSPILVVLEVGLLPLEIIIFLITGETKAFTILFELVVKYWDSDNYPIKLYGDIINWLEKSWVKF